MKKIALFLSILLLIGSLVTNAQTVELTGVVTSSEDGSSIPGVSVSVKGTTLGTITDIDGNYTLKIPADASTLVFSFVGMATQEVAIEGKTTVNAALESRSIGVDEIVVTALGISREKKALGYSVQDVKGDDITKAKETNIINSLQGRVSGAQITNTSGAAGASTRIVIRGVSSLDGNNQPLFVIDGVPMDNSSFGSTGTGGTDRGSGASDINPDDVETITILKGANASALYGSRASNGVVVITTKKGKGGKMEVRVTNTTSFEDPLRLPDFQNGYGQGNAGKFSYVDGAGGGINDGSDESWGPKLDAGLMIPQFNSPQNEDGSYQPTPWVSHPENIRNIFETGITSSTNVSLTGGDAKTNFRLSFTNLDQKGMIPNTDFKKKTLSFSAASSPTDKLTFSASGNYVASGSDNQPGYGYNAQNIMQQVTWTGRNVDYAALKAKQRNEDGTIFNWSHNYHNNPYMTLYENLAPSRRNRFIGNAMVNYKFTDYLSAFVRSGGDIYSNWASSQRFIGDMDYGQGYYSEAIENFKEINTDFLIAFDKGFGDFDVAVNIGGNRLDRRYTYLSGTAPELSIPGVYNVSNSAVTATTSNYLSEKRVNSLYAFGQVGYKGALFVDFSVRNDWSSTLPIENSSYLYPSVSLSGVITEMFDIESDVLSFAKVRGSWAQVGGDTDPYALSPTISFGSSWNADPKLLNLAVPNTLPNSTLKPQQTTSIEFGVDMRFFMDRLRLDVTYYDSKSENQIVNIPISGSTGFTAKTINAGRIDNSGIEVLLGITPVKTANFKWDVTVNFAKNNNEVVELAEGIEQFELGGYWSLDVMAIPGEAYGQLYGYDYERDPKGNVIYYDGLPTQGDLKLLGGTSPDWIAGILNEFTYKGLSASFLIDQRKGSDLYSMTTTWGRYAGALDETLIGREGGIVGNGVMPDGNGGFVTNTVVADAERFNKAAYSNDIASSSVFDASYIKLREAKIGYTFKTIPRTPIKDVNISLVGRNLAILSTSVPHVDPETAFSSGNVQGLEYGQLPSARSLGFSVSCKF
ncbi:MAG: SusC/RagA family TonB-linked outer membrane protein [Bacteroidetes bacterium]|nr:SusC/RagA family TonB-linked outer membrane protein [Bacteroidota bacterium]